MKGNGAKTAHDHRYSAGKSRPIRNSDAIEPTRQHQIMDLQRFPNLFVEFSARIARVVDNGYTLNDEHRHEQNDGPNNGDS